jgi:hypothetical protein
MPLSSFNLGLPKSIVDVVNKSMALTPDGRFGTAAEMGNALYREFKLICDRAPSDVIYNFIKNPAVRGPDIEVAACPEKKSLSTPAVVGLTAGGAVLLLVVVFIIARFFHFLP